MISKLKTLLLVVFAVVSTSAHSALILQSADYNIDATVGNTITSNDFPLSGNSVVIAGPEFSQSASLTFTSSGFPQTFIGTVSFDLTADTITVGWSGTAQGVGLNFDFTNMMFDLPGSITGIQLVSQSCTASNLACTDFGLASFKVPNFTANSVIGMGINLFGFQPGTSFSQTYRLITEASSTPPPPNVPEPSTLALFVLSLFGLRRLQKYRN